MVRELIISLYLLIFKWLFNLFKLFPLENKVVFLITFGDNSQYVFEEMRKQGIDADTVVLYKGSSIRHFESYNDIKAIPFESANLAYVLKSVYHLATSKTIFIDNYFGVLSVTDFKDEVTCVQLWHASGAIKKFGLEDESNKFRSKRAHERFLRVYQNFHKIVVGSDVMANIFMKAFNVPGESILRTGIPRTDFFYDKNLQNELISELIKENPDLKYKKKILYAPTYRDSELDSFQLELDLKKLYEELADDHILLLRLHPAIKSNVNYSDLYPGFVYDYSSSKYDINELLLISTFLISDYSSIPYEYSLLNRPMIFFAYDLEDYQKERGLWDQYESMVPGPVVKSTTEIIKLIREEKFDHELIGEYARKWNKYSNGKSCENLINYLFGEESVAVKRRAL
ncbi:CDP-glycerol--glycerophosphate glycerophosphotransferase [Bacillus sp. 7894-2]|nr:CDP-glycerol--glycerophosphate glycerophosphotransferase [Bacillus sp. 7894-2]